LQDLQVFKELKSTNSIVDKQAILAKYKDSQIVQDLFEACLNPYRLFQFTKMPCQFISKIEEPAWSFKDKHDCYMAMLKDLELRLTTGNQAKETVSTVMRFFDEEQFEIYFKVLIKAPIGVTAKTVNKVWPGLIPEFDLMLAPNEIADITKVKTPIHCQPKLDGYRLIYHKGSMYSRSGKAFANKNINDYFSTVFSLYDYTLDGELYASNHTFNQLQTIVNTHNGKLPPDLKFVVFDAMDARHWDAKKCPKPYSERYKLLNKVVAHIGDHKKVLAISSDLVNTSKEIVDLYKGYLAQGLEGAMLKDPEGLYQWKRTTIRSGEILKVKPFKTGDFEVTGIYDGEGKNTGVAGGVVIDVNGVAVRVGSGFDDATRKAMADKPSDYIGKTVEVRYLEVTEDGSLRNNSFVRWREDKD